MRLSKCYQAPEPNGERKNAAGFTATVEAGSISKSRRLEKRQSSGERSEKSKQQMQSQRSAARRAKKVAGIAAAEAAEKANKDLFCTRR